jgi:HK97 family phage prohead protease
MKKFERRMAISSLEVRGAAGSDVTLTGYASTFNDPYDMGWYTEDVDPGAFKRTLGQKPDVRFLINHAGLPLARTVSGTMNLETDARGLVPFARVNKNDPDVASLLPKIERGDVNQMSFGFHTIDEAWTNDMSKRTLKALDLNGGDVSVVTYPANPNTSVGLRSGGLPNMEAITAALRTLETRAASQEDIASVLTRALAYFTAIDNIVDNAQEEFADVLGIPNPDADDSEDLTADSDEAVRKALAALELRKRQLQLL